MWPSSGCSWDELVRRVQLAEELGFDGVWGFDHFQPMYGEGPGETFEGMTTLAALAGRDVAHPARAARHRRDLPPPVGVRRPGAHRRPRVARPARPVARRGVVRRGAHQARHPLPVDRRPLRPARGRPRDREAALHRRGRVLRGQAGVAAGAPRCGRSRCRRPHPPIWIGGAGPKRTLPIVARYADVWHTWGTPKSLAEPNARIDELAAEAGRDPKSIQRAGSLSLDDLETARKHAGKWVRRRLRLPRLRLARGRRVAGRGLRQGRPPGAHVLGRAWARSRAAGRYHTVTPRIFVDDPAEPGGVPARGLRRCR